MIWLRASSKRWRPPGVRAAREANGLGGLSGKSIDVDRAGRPVFSGRSGLHRQARQLLSGDGLPHDGLALYPAPGRPSGLPGGAGRPHFGLRRLSRKSAISHARRPGGRGPGRAIFDGSSPPSPTQILARMTPHDLTAEPDLAARLATPGYRAAAEHVVKRVRLELLAAHRAALHDSRSCGAGNGGAACAPGRTRGGKRPLARGTGAPCR